MLHQVEDEFGQVWYVGKGDPAHESVQQLHTRHYTWIVLPRSFIQAGDAVFLGSFFQGWKEALRKARQIGYNSQGGRRHIRLAECLKVLGG